MSISGRVLKNTIYLYIKSIVSMIVMLFVTRIVLQALGVIDYGIYNVVAGSIAILGFFRNSLAVTMQRFLNHYQGEQDYEKQKQVFNIGVIYHWCIAFILLLLFVVLGYFLFDGILNIPLSRIGASKIVYICLIVNAFLTVITAPYDAAITAHENMLFYSFVGIVESLMKLIVAIAIMYLNGDKLVIYSLLMMGVPFLETMVLRIYCKRKYCECIFTPQRYFNRALSRQMLSFAGWSLLGSTSGVVSSHGANIALNHFFGAAINAVAGIANQIQGVLALVFSNLMKSLTPVIYKSEGSQDLQQMMKFSLYGCKYSTLLFSMLAIPVFIQAPYLLRLWLVDVPEWCVLFVRLQLVRAVVEQLGVALVNPLNATNHIKLYNIISCFFYIIPVVFLIVLYAEGFQPYWHFIVSILLIVMGQNVTLICLCKKYCGLRLRVYLSFVIRPAAIVILPSLALGHLSLMLNEGFLSFVICFFITTMIMATLIYSISEESEKEKIVDALHLAKNKAEIFGNRFHI